MSPSQLAEHDERVSKALDRFLMTAAKTVGAYEMYREMRRRVDAPIHQRLMELERALNEYQAAVKKS